VTILAALSLVIEAAAPLKLTLSAPDNLTPLIVTTVPTGPEDGETVATVGAVLRIRSSSAEYPADQHSEALAALVHEMAARFRMPVGSVCSIQLLPASDVDATRPPPDASDPASPQSAVLAHETALRTPTAVGTLCAIQVAPPLEVVMRPPLPSDPDPTAQHLCAPGHEISSSGPTPLGRASYAHVLS
jgi:hypothetical protein